jgi:hypothetical protein
MAVSLGDAAAVGDFIADPNDQDPRKKNEEGGEDQPRELHPNHGSAGGSTSVPQWNSTNPQTVSFCWDGENGSFLRKASAAWSSFGSPEDLSVIA